MHFLRAAIAQLVLLAYLELVEWVDLFPWNDVRGGNGQPALDLALGVVFAATAAGTFLEKRVWTRAAAILTGVWLLLQIYSWWVPYLRGASPLWERIWRVHFAQTVQVLPSSGNHLPPDACHLLLQILIAAAFALSLRALYSGESSSRSSSSSGSVSGEG